MATEVIQKLAPPNPHITRAPVSCYRPPLSQPYVCPFQPVMFTSLTSTPNSCAVDTGANVSIGLRGHNSIMHLSGSECLSFITQMALTRSACQCPPTFKQLPLRAPCHYKWGALPRRPEKRGLLLDCCWFSHHEREHLFSERLIKHLSY